MKGGSLYPQRGPLCWPAPVPPPQSPLSLELLHSVIPDSLSHSTIPKCQGDSLPGEALLAPCCRGGLSGFLVLGGGALGALGQHPLLGCWDFDPGVQDKLS